MKRIAVYCGSSTGTDIEFEVKALELGKLMASKNIELVYGGAKIGLMGAVAQGVLSEGGHAIGVLPKFLQTKEVAHDGLSQMILVDTMHERKTIMNDLCDAVIALPGGFGTMEEFFEMLTWGQLGLHKKPIGILDVNGFYKDLIHLIDMMVNKGFLKDINRKMVLVSEDINELLKQMRDYQAPEVKKWISKETT